MEVESIRQTRSHQTMPHLEEEEGSHTGAIPLRISDCKRSLLLEGRWKCVPWSTWAAAVNTRLTLSTLELPTLVIFGLDCTNIGSILGWIILDPIRWIQYSIGSIGWDPAAAHLLYAHCGLCLTCPAFIRRRRSKEPDGVASSPHQAH